MLVSSRNKITKNSLSKMDIDIINHEFLFLLCLLLCTNVLLLDVLIILIHHSVLFFSILSQKEKIYVERKTIYSQAA